MKTKGTLPLIWKNLNETERKIYGPFVDDSIKEIEFEERKFENSKRQKVTIKTSLPLVAKLLDVEEKELDRLYDVDFYIKRSKNRC